MILESGKKCLIFENITKSTNYLCRLCRCLSSGSFSCSFVPASASGRPSVPEEQEKGSLHQAPMMIINLDRAHSASTHRHYHLPTSNFTLPFEDAVSGDISGEKLMSLELAFGELSSKISLEHHIISRPKEALKTKTRNKNEMITSSMLSLKTLGEVKEMFPRGPRRPIYLPPLPVAHWHLQTSLHHHLLRKTPLLLEMVNVLLQHRSTPPGWRPRATDTNISS